MLMDDAHPTRARTLSSRREGWVNSRCFTPTFWSNSLLVDRAHVNFHSDQSQQWFLSHGLTTVRATFVANTLKIPVKWVTSHQLPIKFH